MTVFNVDLRPDTGHDEVTTDELYDAISDLDGGLVIDELVVNEDGTATLVVRSEVTDKDWNLDQDFE